MIELLIPPMPSENYMEDFFYMDKICSYCHKIIPRNGLPESHYKRKKTCSKACALAKYKSGHSIDDRLDNVGEFVRDFKFRVEQPRTAETDAIRRAKANKRWREKMASDPEFVEKRKAYLRAYYLANKNPLTRLKKIITMKSIGD